MIEFGSDFHYINQSSEKNITIESLFPSANYYADGRQALIHLYRSQGWERLWVPEYFCYDVVDSLKRAGLDLRFYVDYPGYHDDSKTLEALKQKRRFHPRDAVLRVNYFGTRSFRSNDSYPVPVVEDHTHDLLGGWAFHSKADWCIASLRKTLPIPEGGILWSPIGMPLPSHPNSSDENETIAAKRWKAMKLKAQYLAGESVEKTAFRAVFVDTEPFFDTAPICSLDSQSMDYLSTFNIKDWYSRKCENWSILHSIRKEGVHVLEPESLACYPFSLVLFFDSLQGRDRVRKSLIENNIYPAILWDVPAPTDGEIFKFSRGMLSIHCDARYSTDDIQKLKSIIESIL